MEKSMKITEQWLIDHDACEPAITIFNKQKRSVIDSDVILDYLLKKRNYSWAIWLIEAILYKEVCHWTDFRDYCHKVLNNVGKPVLIKNNVFKTIAQYGKDLLKKIEKGEKCTY